MLLIYEEVFGDKARKKCRGAHEHISAEDTPVGMDGQSVTAEHYPTKLANKLAGLLLEKSDDDENVLAAGDALPSPIERDALPSPIERDALPSPTGRDALPSPAGRDALPSPTGRDALPSPAGRDALPSPIGRDALPSPIGRDALPSP